MIREELENKLIKRFGRTFASQQQRVMDLFELDPLLLRAKDFWVGEQQAFPWLKTIMTRAAAEAAMSALGTNIQPHIRELVRTSAVQASQVQVDVLIKNLTTSQGDAISIALDSWFAGEVDRAGFEALIASEFGENRAIRIAVTEATRVSTAGQMEAARELQGEGFDVHYIFHQRSDYEGCGCDDLDGQEVGLDEYDKHPPIHVNCNCELELVFKPPDWAQGQTIDELYAQAFG